MKSPLIGQGGFLIINLIKNYKNYQKLFGGSKINCIFVFTNR